MSTIPKEIFIADSSQSEELIRTAGSCYFSQCRPWLLHSPHKLHSGTVKEMISSNYNGSAESGNLNYEGYFSV